MSDFRLLHGVEIKFFGKTERIESVVSGVGSIEGSWSWEEGNSDGLLQTIVSATVKYEVEERQMN